MADHHVELATVGGDPLLTLDRLDVVGTKHSNLEPGLFEQSLESRLNVPLPGHVHIHPGLPPFLLLLEADVDQALLLGVDPFLGAVLRSDNPDPIADRLVTGLVPEAYRVGQHEHLQRFVEVALLLMRRPKILQHVGVMGPSERLVGIVQARPEERSQELHRTLLEQLLVGEFQGGHDPLVLGPLVGLHVARHLEVTILHCFPPILLVFVHPSGRDRAWPADVLEEVGKLAGHLVEGDEHRRSEHVATEHGRHHARANRLAFVS